METNIENTIKANLIWPPAETSLKTNKSEFEPKGSTHLISLKGFSFYSNPIPSYGGDESQLTPEDFFLISLSSCQFMTFFSIAGKAKLGLIYYEDNSELFLGGDKIKFVEKIVLNLKMKFEEKPEVEKIIELCHKAHKYCIIGNSIKSEVEFRVEII